MNALLTDICESHELNVLLLAKIEELETATGDRKDVLEGDINDIEWALK